MATEQLLLRLPGDLVRRFKRSVPCRRRSAFVQQLLEQALPLMQGDDDPLYQATLAVARDVHLADEMAEWEAATVGDGLIAAPTRRARPPHVNGNVRAAPGELKAHQTTP
jgi:hypothetical protein